MRINVPEADDDGGSAGGWMEGKVLLLLFFNLIGLHLNINID